MHDVLRGARRAAGRVDQSVFRRRMVERLEKTGIRDRRVLAAFAAVPRHLLVPDALLAQAYQDAALPIGEGQTISAPGVVAAMARRRSECAAARRCSISATGSGYRHAILSQLAARVVSVVERMQRLAARARRALDQLGHDQTWWSNWGDGTRGQPEHEAPFDQIGGDGRGGTIFGAVAGAARAGRASGGALRRAREAAPAARAAARGGTSIARSCGALVASTWTRRRHGWRA